MPVRLKTAPSLCAAPEASAAIAQPPVVTTEAHAAALQLRLNASSIISAPTVTPTTPISAKSSPANKSAGAAAASVKSAPRRVSESPGAVAGSASRLKRSTRAPGLLVAARMGCLHVLRQVQARAPPHRARAFERLDMPAQRAEFGAHAFDPAPKHPDGGFASQRGDKQGAKRAIVMVRCPKDSKKPCGDSAC